MINNSFHLFVVALLVLFVSCQNSVNQKEEILSGIETIKVDPLGNVIKDTEYYKSKGYQVFPEYDLAVDCPCTLEDGSMKVSSDFDFVFGCFEDQNSKSKLAFYQIIINKLPLGYRDLSSTAKKEFEEEILSKFAQGTCKDIVFYDSIYAKVCDYHQNGYDARALIFIWKGRTYGFNLMTNYQLEQRFNKLTNHIKLIDIKEIKGENLNEKYQIFDHELFSISYPENWEQVETGYEKTVLAILSPYVDQDTYRQNVNIIVSDETRSYDQVWTSVKKQMSRMKGFKVIDRSNYEALTIMGKRTEYNAYLEDFYLRMVTFEFLVKNKLVTITFATDEKCYSVQKEMIKNIVETIIIK